MEWIIASAIGMITATGVFLLLRPRTFPVILGLVVLTYAVNLFVFSMGRLAVDQPAVIREDAIEYTDPLPQALVLTAIVISFGTTAFAVVLALRAYLESGDDHVDVWPSEDDGAEDAI
ncbi:MAG TPA: Na+/H+ antiporter subunit C [Pirellulaceae bacterium]|nr:Na+/H+ antiporter subunit C [Pirellulaceae bacterium]